MKKSYLAGCVLFLLCGFVHAAEELDDGWTEFTEFNTATFGPWMTFVNISVADTSSSDYGWGNYSKKFEGALGAVATIEVTEFNSTLASNVGQAMGLRKYVAANAAGNRFLMELFLETLEGSNTLSYRIREREEETNNTVQILAQGIFGEWSGMWTTNENIKLGLWYANGIAYFYCSKFPDQVIQIRLPAEVTDLDEEIDIFAWALSDGSISGTVSDLNVGYSLAQMDSLTGLTTDEHIPVQSEDLSFSVPFMTFDSMSIWTQFKYHGSDGEKLLFELEDWGVNE